MRIQCSYLQILEIMKLNDLVIGALLMALRARKYPTVVIVHSRCSQYSSRDNKAILVKYKNRDMTKLWWYLTILDHGTTEKECIYI